MFREAEGGMMKLEEKVFLPFSAGHTWGKTKLKVNEMPWDGGGVI